MDDIYRINAAKTEFREAYNTGDVDRLLAVFADDGFTSMSEGAPSQFGGGARSSLLEVAAKLFADYAVQMSVIIINIVVQGITAYDFGWHEFTLRPKGGGEPIRKRLRYFELWSKDLSGEWKIAFHINNQDVREQMGGSASHWFLSEEERSTTVN
jgi:ketosteroid isomerase-like protein